MSEQQKMPLMLIYATRYAYDVTTGDYHENVFNFYANSLSDIVGSIGSFTYIRASGLALDRDSAEYTPKELAECAAMARFLADVTMYANSLDPVTGTMPAVANAWRAREHHKIQTRQYRLIPRSFHFDFPVEHFAHLPASKDDPQLIAWTESADKGMRDKQTVGKFGRYLKRYFPTMSDPEVQNKVREFTASQSTATFTYHETTDRDTIRAIFETKMSACDSSDSVSCMYGNGDAPKFESWSSRPYDVYSGSPDVAVAYIRSNGEILARTVVSTRDKVYVRIYASRDSDIPHTDLCTLMKNHVTAAGYTHGGLAGSRLTTHKHNGAYTLPYLDGHAKHVSRDSDYWIVSDGDGEYDCDQTDGRGTKCEQSSCYDCGDRYSDDDLIYCDDRNVLVCSDCHSSNYVEAIHNYRGHTTTVHRDNAIRACDGEYYTIDYARDQLTEIGGDYHTDGCNHVFYGCDEEDHLYSDTESEHINGEYHIEGCSHIVTVVCDGERVHEDYVEYIQNEAHREDCGCGVRNQLELTYAE